MSIHVRKKPFQEHLQWLMTVGVFLPHMQVIWLSNVTLSYSSHADV